MADRFSECLEFTLKYEGDDSNDPRDPGGATRNGITQGTYDAWRKQNGRAIQSVFTMSALERNAIYLANYWNAMDCGTMPPGVDLAVFDAGVNSGTKRALLWKSAAPGTDRIAIIKGICARRLSFVEGLRTFAIYGRGWRTRIAACEAEAIKVAVGDTAPKVLASEARVAAAKAASTTTMIATTASAGAGVGLLHQSFGGQAWLTILLLFLIATGVAVLIIRLKNQETRAQALDAAAKTSSPAVVTTISTINGAVSGGDNV